MTVKVVGDQTTQDKMEQLSVKLGEITTNINKLQQWHGFCVRSIDCECDTCIRIDATSPGSVGRCLRSIDCECNSCIEGDTSLENNDLKCDETEINQPSHSQVHDDLRVELDSLVLVCSRELELSSLCFSTWLKCVEIKTIRVASYLFDKMSERDHVQVVHVFISIMSKFSLVSVGNGLVVPVWDPGIGLKIVKLVGHTNNVRELLMEITNMFCLHRPSDDINRVWDTGWKWFMLPSLVHIHSVCSGAIIPTYSPVYDGKGDLSSFQSLIDPKVEFESLVLVGRATRNQKILQPSKDCFYEKKLYTSINLDEGKSCGAAVLDVILIGKGDKKVQELLVVDATLLDLGLEIIGGMINSRNATTATKDEQIFPTLGLHNCNGSDIGQDLWTCFDGVELSMSSFLLVLIVYSKGLQVLVVTDVFVGGLDAYDNLVELRLQCVSKTRRVLMLNNFLPLPFDPGGTIPKYHIVVEKVVSQLICNLGILGWLLDCSFSRTIFSSCLKFYGKIEKIQVTAFQETLRELLENWSTKSRVTIGIFSLGTFGKVELSRSLVTTIRVAVGLHILLLNITGFASLRDGAAKVNKLVIDLQFTFDPGGVLIGLEKRSNFMKKYCCLSDSRETLMFLRQDIIELNREVSSCQGNMDFPAERATKEWRKAFIWDTYCLSSLPQDIARDNQLLHSHLGEHFLKFPFDPGGSRSAF